MNKLNVILNELENQTALKFVSACVAKHRNLVGVPRICIHKNTRISTKMLKEMFESEIEYYENLDNKYSEFIDIVLLDDFINHLDYIVIFDLSRVNFNANDELFENIPQKFKKLFNLNTRNSEQKKFLQSNCKHFNNANYTVQEVIKHKLNQIWTEKWGQTHAYMNDIDEKIINNIVDV